MYIMCIVCLGYLSFFPTSAIASVLCTCISMYMYVYVHVSEHQCRTQRGVKVLLPWEIIQCHSEAASQLHVCMHLRASVIFCVCACAQGLMNKCPATCFYQVE